MTYQVHQLREWKGREEGRGRRKAAAAAHIDSVDRKIFLSMNRLSLRRDLARFDVARAASYD